MNAAMTGFDDRIGILLRTFPRPSLEEALDAARAEGYRRIQLNLTTLGLPLVPTTWEPATGERVARAFAERGMRLDAVSGTFNMIHPDEAKRREGLRGLDVLAGACRSLGTSIVTLCTGTRDPEDMWRGHPANGDPSAWSDLLASMREAAAIAERHGVTLAFEPEVGNVVDSAAKARRLIDEVGSPRLKVVLDAANLLRPDDLPRMSEIIDEAFALLAPDVALIHAKEISADGHVGEVEPGKGVLDFARVFRRAMDSGLDVPILVHGLPEASAGPARALLGRRFALALVARTFRHDGIDFRYLDTGEGLPLVFQHGLSGDMSRSFDLMATDHGVRFVSFDARYHGATRPLGPPEGIGFDQSADDLLALLDHLGISRAVIGGLSMGAGIALNFALRYPERTLALVLSRPAWLDEPLGENVRMFPEIADLLRRHGRAGREVFAAGPTYARALAESTDSAATMLGMFDDPTAVETVERFVRIPGDCPSRDRSAWHRIGVPTLVLANDRDPIHPAGIARVLASEIPGAEIRELTPKGVDPLAHDRDFNRHLREFLDRHFPGRRPT